MQTVEHQLPDERRTGGRGVAEVRGEDRVPAWEPAAVREEALQSQQPQRRTAVGREQRVQLGEHVARLTLEVLAGGRQRPRHERDEAGSRDDAAGFGGCGEARHRDGQVSAAHAGSSPTSPGRLKPATSGTPARIIVVRSSSASRSMTQRTPRSPLAARP